MNKDLLWIKKRYGERFAHLCRELFPTILENEGILPKILDKHFVRTKLLYDDLVNSGSIGSFKSYIYGLFDDKEVEEIHSDETPSALLEKAGYTLYECNTEDDIQSFKKYYAPGEELCTFRGNRLNSCYVFFAVKNNVDEIKREDFPNPDRQDEYGTSVISIQFARGNDNTISIKNRYNHTVESPDSTFSNNLDNIIPGLKNSFERMYGFNTGKTVNFELDGYVLANNGKFYRYNYEINNQYFCPDNTIVENGFVTQLNNHYILMETVTLFADEENDRRELQFCSYEGEQAFLEAIHGFGKIVRFDVRKKKNGNRVIKIYTYFSTEPIIIELDSLDRIVGYTNNRILEIDPGFLKYNNALKRVELRSVKKICRDFLSNNVVLEELIIPEVEEIGDDFLNKNEELVELYVPKLKEIGNNFLDLNNKLERIEAPNLVKVGHKFMESNGTIREINFPNLTSVGNNFLCDALSLEKVNLSNIRIIGSCFLLRNVELKKLFLPNVEIIFDYFLGNNKVLDELYAPNLQAVSGGFLDSNISLTKLDLPKLSNVYGSFLPVNTVLKEIFLPSLKLYSASEFLTALVDMESFESVKPKVQKLGER